MVAEERFNYCTSVSLPIFESEGENANWERKLIDAVLRRFHKFKGQCGISALELNSKFGTSKSNLASAQLSYTPTRYGPSILLKSLQELELYKHY